MDWYYAIDNQQQGPVSAGTMIELAREGSVVGRSLVWRSGLGDWTVFNALSDEVFTEANTDPLDLPDPGEAPARVETGMCAYSGWVMPRSEMLPYGHHLLAPEFKEAFVQRVMESGAASDSAISESGLRYVGFWWRVLGELINLCIFLIPLTVAGGIFTLFAMEMGKSADPGFLATALGGLVVVLGAILTAVLPAFYYTLMIGKYQATAGHMAIGSKVVNPDGSRIGYGKSFVRFLCHVVLGGVIATVISVGSFVLLLFVTAGFAAGFENNESAAIIMVFPVVILGESALGMALGLFPFWMAGIDPEKRALHDRICSTRVVRK